MSMRDDIEKVLISEEELQARIAQLTPFTAMTTRRC